MSDKSSESRRKLLKSIVAGSGAIVSGKNLPESWSRPVVDSVMLPAHAQTSLPLNYSTNLFSVATMNPELLDILLPPAHAGFSIDTAVLAVFFQPDATNYNAWFQQNYQLRSDVYVGSGTGTAESSLAPECPGVGDVLLTLNSGPNTAGIDFTMTRVGENDTFTGTLMPDEAISPTAPDPDCGDPI